MTGNSEIADRIIGFHAQQAVEKWLRRSPRRGTRHSAIHDIDRLIEIVEGAGIEVPLDRDRLAVLPQYAVPLRYDELLDSESLEREVLVALVSEVGEWVAARSGRPTSSWGLVVRAVGHIPVASRRKSAPASARF